MSKSAFYRASIRTGCQAQAALLAFALLASGCIATDRSRHRLDRAFHMERDTFAYANELKWVYEHDPLSGTTVTHTREPEPDYTHHCFVMARAARQFFLHAEFHPEQPQPGPMETRKRVREVLSRSSRRASSASERVPIPGYGSLNEFSRAQDALLKAECGGPWQSYVQRGHWRMIFPFSRRHQEVTAERLIAAIQMNWPPVVHVVTFPELTINHAVVAFDYTLHPESIIFDLYDPNAPGRSIPLTFHRDTRTFSLAANDYFAGGSIKAYEVFCGLWY